MIYLPISQNLKSSPDASLLVRAHGDLPDVMREAQSQVDKLGRKYVFAAATLGNLIDGTLARERMLADLLTFFSMAALALSLIGLYGILAFAVQKRRREFAVRTALGATRSSIFLIVFWNALGMIGVGIVVGGPLALGAIRVVSNQVEGMDPRGSVFLFLAAALFVVSGLFIAAIPAAGAARVDPATALKDEGR